MSNTLVVLWNQFEFWFQKKPDGFYKFLKPCNHRLYREGDSWCEQARVSENTFRKNLKKICVSYASKTAFLEKADPFQGRPYACYFDRLKKMTTFIRNDAVANTLDHSKILRLSCVSDCVSNIALKHNYNLPPKSPINKPVARVEGEGGGLVNVKVKEKPSEVIPLLAQEMHAIWVEETNNQVPPPRLSHHFAQKLLEALRTFFQNSIEKWRLYCRSVASSKFLMGQGGSFKAWLIWVIKADVVEKVRGGAYGICTSPSSDIDDTPEEAFSLQSEALVERLTPSDILRQKLTQLKERLTPRTFMAWFNQCSVEQGRDHVFIHVAGSFCREYIKTTFGNHLEDLGFVLGEGAYRHAS